MTAILNTAITAARKAGDIISRSIDTLDSLKPEAKGRNDFVTEVDRKAEDAIIFQIRKNFPDHAILAEESGESGNHDITWIIDPLDGTTNFIHGIPHFGVSIAVQEKGKLTAAVIYDPIRQELFSALRGQSARLNNRRIRVSDRRKLETSVIGTGFPYRSDQPLDIYLQTFTKVLPQVEAMRRPGSAALDLAYVAAGRFDGFWEMGIQAWDMAAGALLIREAGGMVSDLQGGEEFLKTGNIVAGNPKVFKQLLQTIRPELPAGMR